MISIYTPQEDKYCFNITDNIRKFLEFNIPEFINEISTVIGTYQLTEFSIHKNKTGGVYVNCKNTFTGEVSDDLDFDIID